MMKQQQILLAALSLAGVLSIASACLHLNCGGGALARGAIGDSDDFRDMTSSWVGNYSTKPAGKQATVYDSHSWTTGNELVYTVTPPPNGTYTVGLQFAENWAPAQKKGGRVFDIYINGAKMISNFDAWVAAGRKNNEPIVVEHKFIEPVSGEIEIRLARITGNPFISGIHISPICMAKPK